jgi:acyl-CoA synthetase (AMP-forming)/AMP-acid ligase II
MEERIYRSPAPEIEIPEVNLTEHVIGGAAARGDHPAIVDSATGETTSYAELAARVDAVAASLQGQGVGRGDVVALIGPNSAVLGSLPRDPARGRSGHPDQSAAHPR